ncbi:hypothetical protein GCM10022199_10050 [Marihabitans asiaticum]|uniref:Serine/threonine protein kinase n=1 Tax=Marihabitans asiaticum TaxID=415218 RepID=A0A560WHN4_9MICO|nr:serine/threonine-protein kinase [Marihabitans asiaticum]TWD17024.1 serine/threonine protein kinase [Marihabitans asiaticum]
MTTELLGSHPDEPVDGDPRDDGGEDVAVSDFTRIGPYRVVQQLGEGGMGVVHLALDTKGRAVALKALRPHVAHDADARERLAREVATLGRVRSERVAPVFDADLDAEQPYIVTRYVPGPSLDAHVKEHGPLDPDSLLRLARGLAEALRAIHESGIVHRDLKPGNVLLVDGDPVLIDFGIAHDADSSRMTMTGMVMGTPGYLSPEIIEGAEVHAATDWWGWAATLVFAASGRPPFGRGGMEAVLARVCRGDVDLTGVDHRLAPLLYAALNPDESRRPGADEVLRALEQYARGEDVTSALPARARPMPGSSATTVLPQRGTTVLPHAEPSGSPSPVRHQPAPPAYAAQGPPARHPEAYRPPPQQPRPGPPQQWPGMGQDDRESDPRIRLPLRSGVLAALVVALAGGFAIAPLLTLAVVLLGAVVARTIDGSMTSTVMRRYAHGRRRSDSAVAAAKSPLHLLGAIWTTLWASILPALVGVSALLVGGAVLARVATRPTSFDHPALLAGAGALACLTAWWGPGGPSLRRGTRSIVRTVTGPQPVRVAVIIGLVVVGLALGWAAWQIGAPQTWWPLVDSPLPSSTTLPTL